MSQLHTLLCAGMMAITASQIWEGPPTEEGTTWKASFENGAPELVCVQTNGELCSQ